MDTTHEPLWAEYYYQPDLNTTNSTNAPNKHYVKTTRGDMSVALMRLAFDAYKSLSWSDKRKVNKLFRLARRTGVDINE